MFGSFLLIIDGVEMGVNESTSNRRHSKKDDQKCPACLPVFFVLYGLLILFINCFYN